MDVTTLLYLTFSEYGIFTLVAPFLLIFSLTYGLLRKTGLFGKDNPLKEKLYAIIAFVISFYYLYNMQTVIFTQKFLSFFFYETLVLFFLLMIIALLGAISKPYESKDELYNKYKNTAYNSLVGFLGLLVLFAFMYASSQSFTSFGQQAMNIITQIFLVLLNSGLLSIIIIFAIIIGILAWATSKPGSSEEWKKKAKYLVISPGESFYQLYEDTSRRK